MNELNVIYKLYRIIFEFMKMRPRLNAGITTEFCYMPVLPITGILSQVAKI